MADTANQYNDLFENGYSKDVWKLFLQCLVPLLCAIIVKLLDLLIGPLRWKHVATFYILMFSAPIMRRQRPITPSIIVATILVMPSMASGSLTRVGAAFYCLDTLLSPLVLYTLETISDRIEVRWVLIGLLLDLIYLSTALGLSWIRSFWFLAIVQIILIGAAASGIIYGVMTIIFVSGPWDKYFKIIPVGDTGRSVPHPFLRFIEGTGRYVVQLLLFRLNRVTRFIHSISPHTRLSRNPNDTSKQAKDYEYEEIKGPRTVRLLRIKNGWPSQEIRCQFEDFQLGTSTSYEAISYVWGTSTDKGSILLQGHHFTVTNSAYNIIHRHRSAWMDKFIWIDQICINQKDDNEKASQVKLMADIYKGAERVSAYLGQAADAHLVQSLFAELHFKMEGLGYTAEVLKMQYLRASRRAEWNALADFFSNKWFTRVWIIQEAAFAKQLHLFYGDTCIDWEYVSRAIAVISDRHLLEPLLSSADDGSFSSSSFRNVLSGVANVDTMLEFRGDVNYKRKFDLAMVLKNCSRFGATDPRDIVYAILGLTTDNSRTLIQPNYDEACEPRLVYMRAMLIILLKGTKPLETLTGVGIGFERTMAGLPSWIPDWSHHPQIQIMDKIYSAGTRYEPTFKIVQEPHTMLALEGLQFDTVAHPGRLHEVDTQMTKFEQTKYTQQWYQAAESLAKTHAKDPYHNGQPRAEAFIRTMIGDFLSYKEKKKPSTEECWSHYEALLGSFVTSEYLSMVMPLLKSPIGEQLLDSDFLERTHDENEKAGRFLHFAGVASSFRKFCVTEEGRMAIVPPLALEGDVICIIKGTRMPFVLRKTKREDLPVYQIIGCCYVHGVMDGEVNISQAETFIIT